MAASPSSPNPPRSPKPGTAPTTTMQPVQIEASPLAQACRFVQPAALLGLFASQFGALVAGPAITLQSTLPLVAVIQIAYAFVCLPVAGTEAAKALRKPRPGEKRKQENTGPNTYLALFLSLLLTALVTPAIHTAFVLFGAPFLTQIPHTIFLSANFALLALFPLFYIHGVDSTSWLAIGGATAPFDEAFGGYAGALLGAWLGAIPIPLDWDREWQKWPVTILCGMYAGYVLGKTLGGSLLFGKRMVSEMEKEE